ncbi:hypothetical protein LP417_10590 [Polaromonas sp. P1-6]|nr:hypothetical protein LP417_10590 [Polaromonas sp. P1-6]
MLSAGFAIEIIAIGARISGVKLFFSEKIGNRSPLRQRERAKRGGRVRGFSLLFKVEALEAVDDAVSNAHGGDDKGDGQQEAELAEPSLLVSMKLDGQIVVSQH